MNEFDWRELHSPHGHLTGCFRWYHGDAPMCDHEHDIEEERFPCEDARIEMSRVNASQFLPTNR
jgi:hypothetical protein